MKRTVAMLALAILFGCGGGGGGGTLQQIAPTSPAPRITHFNNMGLLVVSDISVQASRGGQVANHTLASTCYLDRCEVQNQSLGFSATFTPYDISDDSGAILTSMEISSKTTRNGVDIYRTRLSVPVGDTAMNVNGYGGWMEHNLFGGVVGTYVFQGGITSEVGFGLSAGNMSGGFPLSGATYTGAMEGVRTDTGSQHGNRVQGNARIDYRLPSAHNPRLDISFENITGASVDNIHWSNVSVGSTGTFETGSINGSFYGPDHEEIGGTFNAHNIAGAFGGKR